jgi:ATP-binding cassette subfamily C protein
MTYHWVRQHSGEDCAAASLAIIAQHYGRPLRIETLRNLVGTHQGGTTLLGLKRGAEALGFRTRAIQADPTILDSLATVPLPAIIYWKGYHFVVFYGKPSGPSRQDKPYVISDPAIGVRHLTRQELLKGWQGCLMLLLEPDPQRFAASTDEPPVTPFKSLKQRLWQQQGHLTRLLPLNLAIGILALATPLLLQFLTDQILAENNRPLLGWVALAVMGLTLLNSLLTWTQSTLVAAFAERLQQSLKLDFGRQVLHLPLAYHEARRSGTAIRRLGDIQQINLLISQLVIDLPIKTFIGLVALGLIGIYSWPLALLTLITGLAMAGGTLLFQPAIRQATNRAFSVAGENAGVLAEAFNGALTLKTMAAAPQLYPEIRRRTEQETQYNLRAARVRVTSQTLAETLAGLGTVALLWWGSLLVFREELTIGRLIAIYGLKESFLQFAIALTALITDWTEIKAITQLLAELFETVPEQEGESNQPWQPLSPQADIHLKQISFHYPGRLPLLDEVSATIPGGQTIALMGPSGCGKSTLAKLLAGLYPMQSGELWVGDQPLANLPLDGLRRQIGLVSQEAFFLHRSITDNLRLACPQASQADIETACRIAGADAFIRQLPQQFDTALGAVGANLSGGQKQRLAIARALLNNPPILILDESTANLDPLTEAEVLDRLLDYRQGKTTILISHRPAVVQRATWLVVLNQGQLCFNGQPEDFLCNHRHSRLAILLMNNPKIDWENHLTAVPQSGAIR